jgi:hypothetical protein
MDSASCIAVERFGQILYIEAFNDKIGELVNARIRIEKETK